VSLFSAVHTGDAGCYRELNVRFGTYQRVLHEAATLGSDAPPPAEHPLFRQSRQQLELDSQLDAIDFTPPHFVQADATWEEFQRMQRERVEASGGVGPWPPAIVVNEASRDEIREVLRALNSGGRDLKVASARYLAQQVDKMAELDDGVYLLSARNEIAIDTLRRHLERGDRDVALFYGAAHGRDLERRLLELGFEREGEPEYLDAWSIDAPPGAR
jgi:hypothetical protein